MHHRAIRMVLCLFSRSPACLRAMNLRFTAILPTRFVCVLFYVSHALQHAIPSCFCHFLPYFHLFYWMFLRYPSVHLRSRIRYHPMNRPFLQPSINTRTKAEGRQKGGRREAGRLQALSIAFCHLCAFVSIFAYQVLAAKVALPWYETKVEKDQFGELPQIAAFCGVQQCCLQSWDGNTGTCLVGYCVQTKLA